MLTVDTQISKGDRSGVWFHSGHGKYRLTGVKRAIAVDYLGLPVAVAVAGARTHDVRAARELLARLVPTAARLVTVMGDRGFGVWPGRCAATTTCRSSSRNDQTVSGGSSRRSSRCGGSRLRSRRSAGGG